MFDRTMTRHIRVRTHLTICPNRQFHLVASFEATLRSQARASAHGNPSTEQTRGVNDRLRSRHAGSHFFFFSLAAFSNTLAELRFL